VLVAVVLDQDTHQVFWPELEPLLRAQRCTVLWDLLVVDVSERQSENYTWWLKHIERTWPGRCRVRRLSMPDLGDGMIFCDRGAQFTMGYNRALRCFAQWHSYEALWLLRCDDRPAPDELTRLWDHGGLVPRPDVGATEVFDLARDPASALAAMGTVGISAERPASG
jgi:hypothetical protein